MITNNPCVDELCDRIARETDLEKVVFLAGELNRLLEKDASPASLRSSEAMPLEP